MLFSVEMTVAVRELVQTGINEESAMKMPVQVVFRNMDKSEWIENLLLEKATGLERFHHHIISCRIVVEVPHKRHQQGNAYNVRIDVSVPEKEIVITRVSEDRKDHQELTIAIRDAFDAVKRQLEDYERKRRGFVKTHEEPQPRARVTKLFPEESYGFLETTDGREVYFHANSVLNQDFNRLEVGVEVAFVEEDGEEGPQASTVRLAA
jgi:cold shock CspA family protein/ribosome-associated translation inhibitor RaiA